MSKLPKTSKSYVRWYVCQQFNNGRYDNTPIVKGPIPDCSVNLGEPLHARPLGMDKKRRIKGRSGPKKNWPNIVVGPFNMSITTPKQDLEMLEFIFKETPQYDIFARYVHTNTVINMFVEFLSDPDNEDRYFCTYFASNSLKKDSEMSTTEWIGHTKTLSLLATYEGRIDNCRRIFIPMREEGMKNQLAHWYLLVLHIRQRYADILDNAPTEGKKASCLQDARTVLRMMDCIFGSEAMYDVDPPLIFATLPFKISGYGPMQPNSIDCDANMYEFSMQYDSDYHRAGLAVQCVRHEWNEVADIQSMAEEAVSQMEG
ncbi:hypothetical protein M0R45_009338 [Rubus argutus]|uniref:Ubiquitin-like protease family profile domain-containing protein n=1 Tax=Rubus argutus TaxID=59490 RepID=A0AAW1Y765_RUBAR